MGVAPVNAIGRIVLDQNGVGLTQNLTINRCEPDPIHTWIGKAQRQALDRCLASGQARDHLAVGGDFERRNGAGRTIEVSVLSTYRQDE